MPKLLKIFLQNFQKLHFSCHNVILFKARELLALFHAIFDLQARGRKNQFRVCSLTDSYCNEFVVFFGSMYLQEILKQQYTQNKRKYFLQSEFIL